MAGYLTQDTLRLVVIGLVGVAAIAMGAATVDSWTEGGQATTPDPAPDPQRNDTMGPGSDSSGGLDINKSENGTTGLSANLYWCAPFLPSTLGTLVYFGAFVGLVVGLKRRYSLGVAAFAMYGLSPVVLIAYFVSTECATFGSPGGGQFRNIVGGAATTEIAQPDVSPVWLLGVLGLVLVATAAIILRSSGDQTVEEMAGPDEEETGTRVADLAAAAGAAADRLEKHNADVDNEVYRAWWEMTSLLDVPNPHSSTPGEFADAAVDVGMGEHHVDELTRLFEEVRYGQRDAESREQQAIDVFRSIEEEYGRSDAAVEDDTTEEDAAEGGEAGDEDQEEGDGR